MCAAVPNPLNVSDFKQYRCVLDNIDLHTKLTSGVFHIFFTPRGKLLVAMAGGRGHGESHIDLKGLPRGNTNQLVLLICYCPKQVTQLYKLQEGWEVQCYRLLRRRIGNIGKHP